MRIAKTKALISFAVTAKLICVFVFTYAKIRFSHDVAQVMGLKCLPLSRFSAWFLTPAHCSRRSIEFPREDHLCFLLISQ